MATVSLQAAYDQARSFLEVNKVEQAIGVAQHILEYFPDNLEAHRILGEAYLAGRQFDQAEAAFGRVLHSDPENIPAHVGLGITYERQSKLDRAVGEFEQALEVRPDMPELRSQLLRLYTDVWGAEGATLRLSRPGLARLYAKGHMLPQAIQEFRSVIDEAPDRFDAWVGLAESLWRDGQTDVAAETCEEILAERPDVLKANLLLGYIRQAAGDPNGEPYWRFAQQLEPYQQVARALFEVMPDLPLADLEISAWDEQAWQSQRSREEQERQAREQVATSTVVSVPAIGDDADFFSGWGDESDGPLAIQPASPSDAIDNDDFLANLLALSSPIDDGSGVDLDSSSGITPFSFDDDFSAADLAMPAVADAEPELTPLSLADLGLSEDEIALLGAEETGAEPELTPFSLADLGLSEDEIALLGAEDADGGPATSAAADAEPELTPFSLADLGLSEDEIALLGAEDTDAALDVAPSGSQTLPFSLADLGLSPDEIAQLNAAADPAQTQDQPEPFSFDDPFDLSIGPVADFDASAPAAAPGAPDRSGDIAGLAPFDWSVGEDSTLPEGVDFSGDNSGIQPFSLDDLDLSSVDDYGMVGGGLPPSLQPFSMDDPQASAAPREMPMPALDPDDSSETGGYSWQQPVGKQHTDFLRADSSAEPVEGSIFSKLKQRASELPKEALPPLPPVSADGDDVAGYFSNDADDVPLHEAVDRPSERFTSGFRLPKEGVHETPAPAPAPAVAAHAEPELTPFSLEDLGLSPEEIALLSGDAAAPAVAADAEPELTPFSLEDLGLSPEEIALLSGDAAAPPAAAKDAAATGDTIVPGWSQGEEPELTPFSLEDLGLSPEEIASLGQLSSTSPTAQPDESIDSDMFDFDMTDTSTEPEAHTADMLGNEVEPFSFDDFDFDSGDATAASASPTIDESVANIKPFSFDDFGLGDVEPALPRDRGTRELSLTDDELAGLDLGEFESLIGGSGSAAPVSEPDVVTGDLALDRLIMLGQRQGFVDLTDIISVVDDPEAEAERIEEIGWTLHRAGIEIRDGDEVIDMEDSESEADEEDSEIAELASRADAGPTALATLSDAEPELTPFSLEELGLSPEEIAALGLSENSPQATFTPAPPAVAADAEPELTPFSLEELGLSPEEIALLSSAAEPAPAPAPVAPAPVTPAPVADAEPDLTPFSLEDLGLSPEEIAALSIVEEAPAASATGDDLFSFDVAEARPVEKAVRTAPRIEEPPPPPPTEDKGFTPEPLDSLDAIWDIPAPVAPAAAASAPAAPQPAREKSVSPARVVLPPLVERESTSRGERREPPPRARDDDRYARRTPPTRSHDDLYARREELAARTRDDRSGRRDTRSASPSRPAARQSFGSFVPTGDETLDEYLIQLDAETDNYGMALALARICAQTGRADLMAYTYKQLLRGSHALDAITEEVQELIDLVDDQAIEQQLYRVLGDALSKQGRLRDAMAAYNHTFGG